MKNKNFAGSNVKYWASSLLDNGFFSNPKLETPPVLTEYRKIGMFEAAELKMARDNYLKEIERIQSAYDQ